MPFYDYECSFCGTFTQWRTMEDRNISAACPECAGKAERLMAAPNLSLMSSHSRKAHAINEKSRHEPRVTGTHRCGAGCGCGPARNVRQKSTRTVDLGKAGKFEASRKTKRPWMLGH
jgi:putative FmdB family regulatory protein